MNIFSFLMKLPILADGDNGGFMSNLTLIIASISPILTFAATFVTIYITLKNSSQARKAALVTAYVNANLEYIKNLKTYLQDFLGEYITNSNSDKTKLMIIKSKIDTSVLGCEELYKEYNEFLEYCIENEYTKESYIKLMNLGEEFVSELWERIKEETGMDLSHDGVLQKLQKNTVGAIVPKKQKKSK